MAKTKILKNKITLVTEQIDYVKSAAIGIFAGVGSIIEDQQYAGISHFIEHMMFKGTEKRSAKDIAEDFDKIGSQFNAFTSKEMTCYYAKTLSSNLVKTTEILLDIICHSKFDQKEMDRERKVICEEIKMTQDAPDELAHEVMGEELFYGTSLGNSIIGTPESLDRINHDVMYSYYKENYSRDSIVVVITGNFDQAEMEKLIENSFFELNETRPTKNFIKAPYSKRTRVITKDIEQSHICMATKAPKVGDDEAFYNTLVLNNIFGGSMSSRLFQHIREQKGLAYSVFSAGLSYKEDGIYSIYAGVSHENVEAAFQGIKEEMNLLAKDGITDDELFKAKEQIKASYTFGNENIVSRMFDMGKKTMQIGRTRSLEEFIENVDKVSKESIKEAISKITDFDNYTIVLVTKNDFDLSMLEGK